MSGSTWGLSWATSWGDSWGELEATIGPIGGGAGSGRGERFSPSSEFEFERIFKRVKKSLIETFKDQPLSNDEKRAVEQSLRGFTRGESRASGALAKIVDAAIAKVQRAELERAAALQQFAEDALAEAAAVAAKKAQNRRRAIILTILLVLL